MILADGRTTKSQGIWPCALGSSLQTGCTRRSPPLWVSSAANTGLPSSGGWPYVTDQRFTPTARMRAKVLVPMPRHTGRRVRVAEHSPAFGQMLKKKTQGVRKNRARPGKAVRTRGAFGGRLGGAGREVSGKWGPSAGLNRRPERRQRVWRSVTTSSPAMSTIRIVVLGAGGVGKSALTVRLSFIWVARALLNLSPYRFSSCKACS